MMDAQSLLDEDDEAENLELQRFYESNKILLRQYTLDQIPHFVLRKIALKLHRTLYGNNWQDIVYRMGVKDNDELAELELYSPIYKELPITMALLGPLQMDKHFGHIIQSLIDERRFDVLRALKPFCEDLFSGNVSNSERREWLWPSLSNTAAYNNFSKSSIPSSNASSSTITDLQNTKLDLENLEMHSNSEVQNQEISISSCRSESACSLTLVDLKDTKPALKKEILLGKSPSNENKNQESSTLVVNIPKTAKCISFISVFIPHTTVDEEIARRLSVELQGYGIVVKLLSEMDHWLILNRTRAINAILCEVDFVTPLVSHSYLQQICPPEIDVEDHESADNCYIYKQISSDDYWQGGMNTRVRPVIVPELQRNVLRPYSLLRDSALRLWGEVEKLVRVLRDNKLHLVTK